MARIRQRARRTQIDFWPGFVDAMATLLLVITFLLAVFVIGQFVLANLLSGSERALSQLEGRLAELANMLALEKKANVALEERLSVLVASLAKSEKQEKQLVAALAAEKVSSSKASKRALSLAKQIAELSKQLQALEALLAASEKRDQKNKVRIQQLGKRLNAALAQKVQELARYRSDFMAALRDLLQDREGFEIVGDRFILQSEVLFDSGSDQINPRGKIELRQVAKVMIEVGKKIPAKIDWVLRVDGHTDIQPIRTDQFPSNWHLSVARAVAVVRFLITQGLLPKRLVAAGFGEFRPITSAQSPSQWKRNRRIEFKLTQR